MFESRGVALGVVASVFMLVVGYLLGQATASLPELKGPVEDDGRLTASEAKARGAEVAFRDAQINGLTARLGGGLAPWDGVKARHERPAEFYADLREARVACSVHANVVGVDCSEPPCIGLLRQVKGDVPAELAACASWTDVLPSPRIEAASVACPSGRQESVVLVVPAAGPRTPEVAATEDARLATRFASIRAGWRCAQTVGDMAH